MSTDPEHRGLSADTLAMIGQTMTYTKFGKPPVTAVVKKIRRVGHVIRDGKSYPGFEMLMGGHWRGPFPDGAE